VTEGGSEDRFADATHALETGGSGLAGDADGAVEDVACTTQDVGFESLLEGTKTLLTH
jgi:hypothetical protein